MAFEINNEESIYEYTSLLARQCGIDLSDKELAYFASEHNYGRDAIAAIETLLDYLAKKQQQITIESMFRFLDFHKENRKLLKTLTLITFKEKI